MISNRRKKIRWTDRKSERQQKKKQIKQNNINNKSKYTVMLKNLKKNVQNEEKRKNK